MDSAQETLRRMASDIGALLPPQAPVQTQILRIEGANSMWGALAVGLAAGVAMGAGIMCAIWVSSTLNDVHEIQRNNEAFIQATYQQAPQIRAEFDRIKAEQEKK